MTPAEAAFDPYLKWLGIRAKDQPPNHYRLLGIEVFEPDPDVIANAADARMMLIKTFQSGKHSELSQKLLNEVAAAKVCLLRPERKEEYDRQLREDLQFVSAGPSAQPGKIGQLAAWFGSEEGPWRLKVWIGVAIAAMSLVTIMGLLTAVEDGPRVAEQPAPSESSSAKDSPPRPVRTKTAKPRPRKHKGPAPKQSHKTQPAGLEKDLRGSTKGPAPAGRPGRNQKRVHPPGRHGKQLGPSHESPEQIEALLPPVEIPVPPPSVDPKGEPAGTPEEKTETDERPASEDDARDKGGEEPSGTDTEGESKLPVPDDEQLQLAEKEIKRVHHRELTRAKTRKQKLELAEKLFRNGLGDQGDSVSRYVLFQMACDLAVSVGEVSATLESVDEIAARYQINPLQTKAELLAKAIEATRGAAGMSAANLEMIETAARLADEALANDEHEVAERISKSALTVAKKTKNPEFIQDVSRLGKGVEQSRREFEGVRKVFQALEKDPDDPEANLAAGRRYCFEKGRWEQGLPYLAKGSDQVLADLAKMELAQPTDPQDQLALGNGWWQQAEREQAVAKTRLQFRAAHWFEQAKPELTGRDRGMVRRRLDQVADVVPPGGAARQGVVRPGNVALAGGGTQVIGPGGGRQMIDGVIPRVVHGGGIATGNWPCEWTIVLDKVYRLREIRLKLPEGKTSYHNYLLATSADGITFVPLADRRQGRWFGWQQILFLSRPVKAIKLQGLFHSGDARFYVSELEAYCIPPTP